MTFPMTSSTPSQRCSRAIPDRVSGPNTRPGGAELHGFNPKTSSSHRHSARSAAAGAPRDPRRTVSATVAETTGRTQTARNEQAEASFPILVERLESSGFRRRQAGHRGGLGIAGTNAGVTPSTVNTSESSSALPALGHDGRRATPPANGALRVGEKEVGLTNASAVAQSRRATRSLMLRRRQEVREAFERPARRGAEASGPGLCDREGRGERLWRGDRPRLCDRYATQPRSSPQPAVVSQRQASQRQVGQRHGWSDGGNPCEGNTTNRRQPAPKITACPPRAATSGVSKSQPGRGYAAARRAEETADVPCERSMTPSRPAPSSAPHRRPLLYRRR